MCSLSDNQFIRAVATEQLLSELDSNEFDQPCEVCECPDDSDFLDSLNGSVLDRLIEG